MADTTDESLLARSKSLPTPKECAPTPEFLRLVRSFPPLFERQGRVGSNPSIDRVSSQDSLNDVKGRKLTVFRKSPCPPLGKRSSIIAPGSSEAWNAPAGASTSPRCYEGHDGLSSPVSRFELLTDVTGRQLRVDRTPSSHSTFSNSSSSCERLWRLTCEERRRNHLKTFNSEVVAAYFLEELQRELSPE
ncbi:hypothetical protein T484DRAFT_1744695 [Baffinella frigidus]|nr:hypothetical protein T484DRAFT_1744695 [Cryptophyta sp. CCMP2293]